MGRKDGGVLLLVRLERALEPGIASPDVVQTARLVVPAEHLPVLPQLRIDIPRQDPGLGVLPQGVHHQAGLHQHAPTGRDLALGKGNLKVLAHLLEQLALEVVDVAAQHSNLLNAAVAVEVAHELQHGLEEAGALAVLAGAGEAAQLLVGRRQHLQALEGRHAVRQVALGAVEALDVGRHGGDVALRLQGAAAHALDALEQRGELGLGGLHALEGRVGPVGLGRLEGGDGLGEVIGVALQGRRDAGAGRDGRWVREEQVEVCDGIVVDYSFVHLSVPAIVLRPSQGGPGADRLDAFNLPESSDRCSATKVVVMAAMSDDDSDGGRSR